MAVRPLEDRVLIKQSQAEQTTAGGIVLPDTAKEKPKEGRVISVGAGKVLDDGSRAKMQLKKGDRIIFTSYAGSDVKVGVDEYLIMREEDVLAIVKE